MSISLEKSIQGCKINQAWAPRMQSDRFENPDLMLCPVWGGVDNTGRAVCPDSFMTKRAGCNSALDRITVENMQRPQYMEYVTLGAQGISANGLYDNTTGYNNQKLRSKCGSGIRDITGNFGLDLTADTVPSCGIYAYENAMAQVSRQEQQLQHGYQNYDRNNQAGFPSNEQYCNSCNRR
jgi:hypothetical protein